jgi:cytochrome b6-f complex iron-sulfur subunit
MSQITRRDFLKILNRTLTVTGLAAIAAPILAYFYPPSLEETPSEPVLVGAESDLPLNAGKTIRYGRYPALVVNTNEGLRAYSAVCTHFACIVKWDPEKGQIACPCHAGYFDPLDGHVLAGPPPTPLASLPVEVRDGQIYLGGTA